jgi:uncharacterized protein (DUF2267 family)
VTVSADLNAAIASTEEWLDDLLLRLGWRDRERAFGVLLAALHAVRDYLQRDEAIYFGAQLPTLLRGFYYEGWHPGTHPPARSRAAFIERIHDGVHRDPAVDADQVARAVFALLAARLAPTEVESAKAALPHALHNLWPS